jgi:energy-coupling factor transport system substrate-specific component
LYLWKKKQMEKQNEVGRELRLALIPLGIGINIGIGALAYALKLPVYLDAIGTVLITIMLGWQAGIITGVLGFIITSIFINPIAIWFIGTQAVIAIYTHLLSKRGAFSNILKTIFTGIGLGIIAAIVSAPIIVYLFGGVTGNGPSLIVAYLVASGKTILKSVLLSGISVEPIDKTIQCLLALFILKSIPKSILSGFRSGSLKENRFIQ